MLRDLYAFHVKMKKNRIGVLVTVAAAIVVAVASLRGVGQTVSSDKNGDGKPDFWKTETVTNGTVIARDIVQDRDGDGEDDLLYGFVKRGADIVFSYSIDKTRHVGVRHFFHEGRRLLSECDSDGDGFYEMMVFFAPDAPNPVEILFRNKGGKVFVDERKAEEVFKDYEQFYRPADLELPSKRGSGPAPHDKQSGR